MRALVALRRRRRGAPAALALAHTRGGRLPADGGGGRVVAAPGDGPRHVGDASARGGQRGAQDRQARALGGIGQDGGVDRAAEPGRQVAAHPAERRQAHPDAARGLRGVAPAHRVDARQRLVEHEPQRVDVGGALQALAARLLGGHVGERPHDVAGARQHVAVGHPRDPEVRELRDAAALLGLVGADDVRGLDVAVDDAARVGVLERVAERHADAQHVAVRQLALAQELRERAPADELGDEVQRLSSRPDS